MAGSQYYNTTARDHSISTITARVHRYEYPLAKNTTITSQNLRHWQIQKQILPKTIQFRRDVAKNELS
jgi:hypothetical protein